MFHAIPTSIQRNKVVGHQQGDQHIETLPPLPGAPIKCIGREHDVQSFKKSQSYADLCKCIEHLSFEVLGLSRSQHAPHLDTQCGEAIKLLKAIFVKLRTWVDEIPLEDQKLQRFGNRSFRVWMQRLRERCASEIVVPLLNTRCTSSSSSPSSASPVSPSSQRKAAAATCYERIDASLLQHDYVSVSKREALINDIKKKEAQRAEAEAKEENAGDEIEVPERPEAPPAPTENDLLVNELCGYLFDAFGNASRIDYGSGHELHFYIFLYVLMKVGVLRPTVDPSIKNTSGENEFAEEVEKERATHEARAIILHTFWDYIDLMRLLQKHYRLEPAGSHGVYGLDDFHHLPFVFGASQLINAKDGTDPILPEMTVKKECVSHYQQDYLYFAMTNWIFENKRGPFHEHSSVIYNVSGIQDWNKVRGGMMKMFEGEVLGKFNVVQHLLFGKHFPYE